MDAVARAIGDAGGATAVFDAGDDTSTGESWEAFSLDSVNAAFSDLPRWGVAGNHDEGDFVADYLAGEGWTMLDGHGRPGPRRRHPARRGRPALERPGELEGRGRAVVRGGRQPARRRGVRLAATGSPPCSSTTRASAPRPWPAAAPTSSSADTSTCAWARRPSRARTAPSATPTRPAPPAARRTPSPSAPSPAATPWSPSLTYRDGRPIGLQPVVVKTNGDLDPLRYEPLTPPTPPSPPPSPQPRPPPPDRRGGRNGDARWEKWRREVGEMVIGS